MGEMDTGWSLFAYKKKVLSKTSFLECYKIKNIYYILYVSIHTSMYDIIGQLLFNV